MIGHNFMKHTVSKIDIALIQLRTAVQMYNKKNFIASITLAAAAEELTGTIAAKSSGTNAAIEEKIFVDQLGDLLNRPRPSFNKVNKARNKLKNELKHNDIGENIARLSNASL